MKKILLLTLLLVVAASAAITIDIPTPPSKVGENFTINIGGSHSSVDAAVDSGGTKYPWINYATLPAGPTNNAQITRPGSGLMVYVSKLGDEAYSQAFDVDIGDPARWQIIGPGQTADPGTEDGKSGSAVADAGTDYTYDINECDVWFNVTDGSPSATISTNDPFGTVSGTTVNLRTVGTWAVVVSGGSYTPDTCWVTVQPGPADKLLLVCLGEEPLPGDPDTDGGKTGTPDAAVLGQHPPYKVDVYAVDAAWNHVDDYISTGIVTVFDEGDNEIGSGDMGDSGHVEIELEFDAVNTAGEYISAVEAGGLSTTYNTLVIVRRGVTDVNAWLDPARTNPGVEVDLNAQPMVGNDSVGAGYPLNISCLSDMGTGSCENLTFEDYMETESSGLASSKVSASDTGTYYIQVSAGTIADTVILTVVELEGLVVQPNPFKNSLHTLPIEMRFKVEQVGVGGASEVYLLIADPFGNTVYTASYDINDVQTNPGEQTIQWNGANSSGNTVASGMYQAVVKITLINGSTSVIKKNFMLIW